MADFADALVLAERPLCGRFHRNVLLSVLIMVSVPFVSVDVFAGDDIEAAKQHFTKGKRLYDVGRYAEAAKEYEAAYEAKDDPALLFNLGQAHRLAGNKAEAINAYRSYLRNSPDIPNRTEVEKWIHELQASLDEERRVQEPIRRQPEPAQATNKSVPTTADRAATPQLSVATSPAVSTAARPVYKRWWPWTIGAVVIAGAAVGIVLGVTSTSHSERVLPPIMGNQ